MATQVVGKELTDMLWSKHNEKFMTEASTLGFGRCHSFSCPKCHGLVIPNDRNFNLVKEHGELVSWEGFHSCGAVMVIFND